MGTKLIFFSDDAQIAIRKKIRQQIVAQMALAETYNSSPDGPKIWSLQVSLGEKKKTFLPQIEENTSKSYKFFFNFFFYCYRI